MIQKTRRINTAAVTLAALLGASAGQGAVPVSLSNMPITPETRTEFRGRSVSGVNLADYAFVAGRDASGNYWLGVKSQEEDIGSVTALYWNTGVFNVAEFAQSENVSMSYTPNPGTIPGMHFESVNFDYDGVKANTPQLFANGVNNPPAGPQSEWLVTKILNWDGKGDGKTLYDAIMANPRAFAFRYQQGEPGQLSDVVTVVPEPVTTGVVGLGLLGGALIFSVYRRKQAQSEGVTTTSYTQE